MPVPPSASAHPEQSLSPLVGASARKLVQPQLLLHQQKQSPRRFLISVDENTTANYSNIAELHTQSEQRLLHVILTPGVLQREMRKAGFEMGVDGVSGISLSDVNRLAKRMFPSLHPSISCASVAPIMCGIVEDNVKQEDVAALLLAMVYSSFVADVVGKAEIVAKDALLHCITRLHISQSTNPETCDGVSASALSDLPGMHSSELFCLWFVKMHMAIMLGKLIQTSSEASSAFHSAPEIYRQEILYMLRLHSNSAVAHLRALNSCIGGNIPQKQQQQQKKFRSGLDTSRESISATSRPTTAALLSPSISSSSSSSSSTAVANTASRALAAAEADRRSSHVNAARTCISANMHLVR